MEDSVQAKRKTYMCSDFYLGDPLCATLVRKLCEFLYATWRQAREEVSEADFKKGLAAVRHYNNIVVKTLVEDVAARIPNIREMYKHLYISCIQKSLPMQKSIFVPPFSSFLHAIMTEVAHNTMVVDGQAMRDTIEARNAFYVACVEGVSAAITGLVLDRVEVDAYWGMVFMDPEPNTPPKKARRTKTAPGSAFSKTAVSKVTANKTVVSGDVRNGDKTAVSKVTANKTVVSESARNRNKTAVSRVTTNKTVVSESAGNRNKTAITRSMSNLRGTKTSSSEPQHSSHAPAPSHPSPEESAAKTLVKSLPSVRLPSCLSDETVHAPRQRDMNSSITAIISAKDRGSALTPRPADISSQKSLGSVRTRVVSRKAPGAILADDISVTSLA